MRRPGPRAIVVALLFAALAGVPLLAELTETPFYLTFARRMMILAIGALLIGVMDIMGRSFLDTFFRLFLPVNAAETAAPAASSMLIYVLMAAVLFFRPQGLFPARTG